MTFLTVLGALVAAHGPGVVKTLGPFVIVWNLITFLFNTGWRAWVSLGAAVITLAFMAVLEYQRRLIERNEREIQAYKHGL